MLKLKEWMSYDHVFRHAVLVSLVALLGVLIEGINIMIAGLPLGISIPSTLVVAIIPAASLFSAIIIYRSDIPRKKIIWLPLAILICELVTLPALGIISDISGFNPFGPETNSVIAVIGVVSFVFLVASVTYTVLGPVYLIFVAMIDLAYRTKLLQETNALNKWTIIQLPTLMLSVIMFTLLNLFNWWRSSWGLLVLILLNVMGLILAIAYWIWASRLPNPATLLPWMPAADINAFTLKERGEGK